MKMTFEKIFLFLIIINENMHKYFSFFYTFLVFVFNCFIIRIGGKIMNVKAIMCDVDGTLLTNEGVVSPKTIEAIRKVRNKGILFGLSTGRDVNSVKTLLSEWGIEGLVDSIVGTGGAEICDFVLNVEKQSYPLDGHLI